MREATGSEFTLGWVTENFERRSFLDMDAIKIAIKNIQMRAAVLLGCSLDGIYCIIRVEGLILTCSAQAQQQQVGVHLIHHTLRGALRCNVLSGRWIPLISRVHCLMEKKASHVILLVCQCKQPNAVPKKPSRVCVWVCVCGVWGEIVQLWF